MCTYLSALIYARVLWNTPVFLRALFPRLHYCRLWMQQLLHSRTPGKSHSDVPTGIHCCILDSSRDLSHDWNHFMGKVADRATHLGRGSDSTRTNEGNKYLVDLGGDLRSEPSRVLHLCSTSLDLRLPTLTLEVWVPGTQEDQQESQNCSWFPARLLHPSHVWDVLLWYVQA